MKRSELQLKQGDQVVIDMTYPRTHRRLGFVVCLDHRSYSYPVGVMFEDATPGSPFWWSTRAGVGAIDGSIGYARVTRVNGEYIDDEFEAPTAAHGCNDELPDEPKWYDDPLLRVAAVMVILGLGIAGWNLA